MGLCSEIGAPLPRRSVLTRYKGSSSHHIRQREHKARLPANNKYRMASPTPHTDLKGTPPPEKPSASVLRSAKKSTLWMDLASDLTCLVWGIHRRFRSAGAIL